MYRYTRYICVTIALFAGIGCFIALVLGQPVSAHGSFDVFVFGYRRNELAAVILLILSGIASTGAMVLFFSKQEPTRRIIILLLVSYIVFAGIVLIYMFLFNHCC
jgi:hypothetical protein